MSLLEGLSIVKDKLFIQDELDIDNIVFKLHRTVTVTILVTFSVLLSLGQVMSMFKVLHRVEQIFGLLKICSTTFLAIDEISVCWRSH